MRVDIVRPLLAAWIASLTIVASAQTTDAVQSTNVYAAPASRSTETPAALDSEEASAAAFPAEWTNVLEDTPRDTRGKPASGCAYDPLERQVPSTCRRQLEIARTL